MKDCMGVFSPHVEIIKQDPVVPCALAQEHYHSPASQLFYPLSVCRPVIPAAWPVALQALPLQIISLQDPSQALYRCQLGRRASTNIYFSCRSA